MATYRGVVELLDYDGSVADTGTAVFTADEAAGAGGAAEWSGTITLDPQGARDLIDAPEAVTVRLPSGSTGLVVPVSLEGSEATVRGEGPPPF